MEEVKLSCGYTFWVQEIERGKNQTYGSNLNPVVTVKNAIEFWEVFQYIKRSNDLDKDCDLYLFKQGIKPEWEDPGNVGGGCFKIKIDKRKSNKLWENAVVAMITPNNKHVSSLNGMRIKIKQKFDEIEIWMSSETTSKQKLQTLKSYLKQNLQVTEQKAYNFYPFK